MVGEELQILISVATPLGGSIVAFYLSRVSKKICGVFSSIVAFIAFLAVLLLAPTVADGQVYDFLIFHVNGLNYLLGIIISFLGILSVLYSLSYMAKENKIGLYYGFILLFIGTMLGMVFSRDLIGLYLFFELSTLTSAILVAHNRPVGVEASYKYFIMSVGGSIFALAGVLLLYGATGTLIVAEIPKRLATSTTLLLGGSAINLTMAVSASVIIGFGVKAGLVPFHAWLPDAHAEAPAPISAILSGAMIKTGAYAMALLLFAVAIVSTVFFQRFMAVVMYLAVISMVVGILMAIAQTDVKRLLAYHSVSQMGYVLLGIGIASHLGITGGLFHLLNHSIFKALLFLAAGNILLQAGTRDMQRLGGLGKRMPITASSFLIGSLAMAGVPPFNGFWSKWFIFWAGIEGGHPELVIFTVIAVVVSFLTLACMVKASRMIFFGELPKRCENVKEAPIWMTGPTMVLSFLCILIGIYPDSAMMIINPAVKVLESIAGVGS